MMRIRYAMSTFHTAFPRNFADVRRLNVLKIKSLGLDEFSDSYLEHLLEIRYFNSEIVGIADKVLQDENLTDTKVKFCASAYSQFFPVGHKTPFLMDKIAFYLEEKINKEDFSLEPKHLQKLKVLLYCHTHFNLIPLNKARKALYSFLMNKYASSSKDPAIANMTDIQRLNAVLMYVPERNYDPSLLTMEKIYENLLNNYFNKAVEGEVDEKEVRRYADAAHRLSGIFEKKILLFSQMPQNINTEKKFVNILKILVNFCNFHVLRLSNYSQLESYNKSLALCGKLVNQESYRLLETYVLLLSVDKHPHRHSFDAILAQFIQFQ